MFSTDLINGAFTVRPLNAFELAKGLSDRLPLFGINVLEFLYMYSTYSFPIHKKVVVWLLSKTVIIYSGLKSKETIRNETLNITGTLQGETDADEYVF